MWDLATFAWLPPPSNPLPNPVRTLIITWMKTTIRNKNNYWITLWSIEKKVNHLWKKTKRVIWVSETVGYHAHQVFDLRWWLKLCGGYFGLDLVVFFFPSFILQIWVFLRSILDPYISGDSQLVWSTWVVLLELSWFLESTS